MIRPATPADRDALGRVAYATAYFGAPAERFFPDPGLFTDLWVGPYLDGVGCCNRVAESDERVVGYVIGTCDLYAYRRYIVRVAPRLASRLVGAEYPRWRGCLPYLVRLLRYPSRMAPTEDFPAQLHLNVLAETRGQGVGSRLLDAHLACLERRGVGGVQLSTTRENEAAIRLYEKVGFEVRLEYVSPLWRPWLGHDAAHVVMTRRF